MGSSLVECFTQADDLRLERYTLVRFRRLRSSGSRRLPVEIVALLYVDDGRKTPVICSFAFPSPGPN